MHVFVCAVLMCVVSYVCSVCVIELSRGCRLSCSYPVHVFVLCCIRVVVLIVFCVCVVECVCSYVHCWCVFK